ncbi:MAG: hypothetical protein HYR84_15770 [Planctomycetes bacterium]|nr:hypothetical protein [Planctomycetota bacterium]
MALGTGGKGGEGGGTGGKGGSLTPYDSGGASLGTGTVLDTGGGGAGGAAGLEALAPGANVGAMNLFPHNEQLVACPACSSGTETRRVQCGQRRSICVVFPLRMRNDTTCHYSVNPSD